MERPASQVGMGCGQSLLEELPMTLRHDLQASCCWGHIEQGHHPLHALTMLLHQGVLVDVQPFGPGFGWHAPLANQYAIHRNKQIIGAPNPFENVLDLGNASQMPLSLRLGQVAADAEGRVFH